MSLINVHPETGIRYGTIYLNNLDPTVADDLFYSGENISEREAFDEFQTELEQDVAEEIAAGTLDIDPNDEAEVHREVMRRFERYCDGIQIDEPCIEGESEGVKYGISWLGGAPLLWVFESPFTDQFDLCSPCVPGACNLDSPNPDGYVGYNVPPEWRDKE